MSVIKNYIYNTLYQILTIIIPLITMPYLTGVFKPDQMGLNSSSLAVVNYFMLFGLLGMQMYANRQIAYVRNDKNKLTKTFWSLYAIQICTCLLSLASYYVFIYIVVPEGIRIIYLIQGINILASLLDISWLFMGLEDFKNVVIRNTVAKVAGLISIFVFIKDANDLNLYILLSAVILIASTVLMWIHVPEYVGKISIDTKIIRGTIKPLIRLFIPQIATQVYELLAKPMLQLLSTTDQVAFYDYAYKIVKIILALVTSIGTVLLPRISSIIGEGKKHEVAGIIQKTFKFVTYLSMPITVGLMSVAKPLVSWYLESSYSYVGDLVSILAVIIIAVSWANIIGVQYLIGTRQEEKYTVSIIISAVANVIMNIILIKYLGAFGATLSLIAAEFIGIILQFVFVRKQLPVVAMMKSVLKYVVVAAIMGIVVSFIGGIIANPFMANIVQGIVGVVIYVGVLFVIKDEVQQEVIERVILMIKKK